MSDTQPEAQAMASAPSGGLSRYHTFGIGLGAGILNGLLGLGGGIFIVPGMIFLRRVSPRVAISTSLGVITALSLAAFLVHLALSGFHFSLLGTALLLVAGAAGSQLGGFLLKRISQRWILFLFSGLTLFSAGNLAVKALLPVAGAAGSGLPPLWGYPVMGGVAGLFSGMLGIGGGGIVLLGFAVLFRTPILGGLPLSLLINVVNAGSGVAAQWRTGHILWREVARLVPSALVGIGIGTAVAAALPADALRLVFAAFFVYMGIRLWRRGLKS